jgi:transcriptional regulator with XRE-family HTH domain
MVKPVDIPTRLKRWRKHEQITQKEAAGRLSIPVGTYINYEQGHRKPESAARNYLIEKTDIPTKNNARDISE